MADPIDVSEVQVRVAATGAGPFALIADLRSYEATHGTENDARLKVFGGTTYVRTGDKTDEYGLGGLYNPTDTNGQNVLRTAYENGTTCVIAFVTSGDAATEVGYTQECNITEYTESADADGDFVETDFTAVGKGDREVIGGSGLPTP